MKLVVELNLDVFATPAEAAVALADLARHLPRIPGWEGPEGKLLFGELGSLEHNITTVRLFVTAAPFSVETQVDLNEPVLIKERALVEEGFDALNKTKQ